MDSPFAPRPIVPSLRLHPVDRSGRERKRKGRSFKDELAGESDEGAAAPHPPHAVPSAPRAAPAPAAAPGEESGHLLDLEA